MFTLLTGSHRQAGELVNGDLALDELYNVIYQRSDLGNEVAQAFRLVFRFQEGTWKSVDGGLHLFERDKEFVRLTIGLGL